MSITLDGTSGITATGSLTGLTTPLAVNQGGTGAATLTANGVVIGNGTSALTTVAPSTSGNVLTSNGTTWTSAAPSGGVTSLNGQTGAITNTDLYAIGSYISGRPTNTTNYAVNATIAGSSLYTISMGVMWNGGWYYPASPSGNGATLVNTGTWRCVTPCAGNGSTYGMSGLWVRIS